MNFHTSAVIERIDLLRIQNGQMFPVPASLDYVGFGFEITRTVVVHHTFVVIQQSEGCVFHRVGNLVIMVIFIRLVSQFDKIVPVWTLMLMGQAK